MSLDYSGVPNSEEVLKKPKIGSGGEGGGRVERTQVPTGKTPVAKVGTIRAKE